MKAAGAVRFAQREITGLDDTGAVERVAIWVERRPGGLWAVVRLVNPDRLTSQARGAETLFEGYELDDALDCANGALEDDVVVSEADGRAEHVRPFKRGELLKPLERWFFGH